MEASMQRDPPGRPGELARGAKGRPSRLHVIAGGMHLAAAGYA